MFVANSRCLAFCFVLMVSSASPINLPQDADTTISSRTLQFSIVSVTSGDLNGDGTEDIILGGMGSSVSILLGRAVYAKQIILSEETPPDILISNIKSTSTLLQMITVGDLNGDGMADLVIPTENGLSVYWGRKTWPKSIDWENMPGEMQVISKGKPQERATFQVSTGDINKDGIDDLLLAQSYAPQPGADFGFRSEDWRISEQDIAVVFLGHTSWAAVLDLQKQSPDVVIRAEQPGPVFRRIRQFSIGDINGDGFGDIVVGSWGDVRGVTEPPDNAPWAVSWIVEGSADLPRVIDLRTNSIDEKIKKSSNVQLRISFWDKKMFPAGRPQVGDLTGDGKKDIVFKILKRDKHNVTKELCLIEGRSDLFASGAHREKMECMSIRGGPSFAEVNPTFSPDPIIGDFNGDGFEDLFVLSGYPDFTYRVLLGRSSFPSIVHIEKAAKIEIFPPGTSTKRAGYGFSHALAKVNGDKLADLMIVDALGGGKLKQSGPGTVYIIFGERMVLGVQKKRTFWFGKKKGVGMS